MQGSIIGAGRLSFRVRDGTGRFPAAVAAVTLFNYAFTGSCSTPFFGVLFGGGVWSVRLFVWIVVAGTDVQCSSSCLHTIGFLVCVSFRPVSTSSLNLLLSVQVWPIDPVVCGGPYPSKRVRNLVLEEVSRLDAFSGYPVRT